jgi:hypothetical protein
MVVFLTTNMVDDILYIQFLDLSPNILVFKPEPNSLRNKKPIRFLSWHSEKKKSFSKKPTQVSG